MFPLMLLTWFPPSCPQASLQQLNEQYELVLKCLKDTEATNKRLLEQVTDRNKLYTDSKVSEDCVI